MCGLGVLEGITIGGKSMREHFEAINHSEAITYVEEAISNKETFSEFFIKSIHQLILRNIEKDFAGVYRTENVIISGATHIPPNHLLVTEQMFALIEWIKCFNGHPLERAARLHADFVKIHPFVDGNGRTARLLMNSDLMKSGYLPVVIQTNNRLAYYEALDIAHVEGDYDRFLEMIIEIEKVALKKLLGFISGK